MNEETQKQGLDDKKKNALLRYIAVLFAVAFLFVLLSFFSQMRDSRTTISELNQNSASALQNAQKLQEANQDLLVKNQELSGQVHELEMALEALQSQVEDLQAQLDAVPDRDETNEALETALTKQKDILEAYEALLQALNTVTPGSQEGNVESSKALENLKPMKDHLGALGLEKYESLFNEKGE